MRALTRVLVLCQLAASVAAAENLPKEMQAKWTMDKAAVVQALPAFALLAPDKQKEMLVPAEKQMPDMNVEFTASKVLFSMGKDQSQEGTYRVLDSANGVVRMEITSKGAEGKDGKDETTAELLASGHLKLTKKGDATVLLFRRVKD